MKKYESILIDINLCKTKLNVFMIYFLIINGILVKKRKQILQRLSPNLMAYKSPSFQQGKLPCLMAYI